MKSPKNIEEVFTHQRFEENIERTDKCWLWKGYANRYGYGYFTVGSRRDGTRIKKAAHVFSYQFYNGPLLPWQVVYRKCTTIGCVNPGHLCSGSRSDMVKMAVKLKRWTQGNANNFPSSHGEKNGRSKLTDAIRRLIASDKETKVLILARRYNVTEQTIYRTQKLMSAW